MDRERIIAEIKRAASANGGKPLGKDRFERETGIREADWCGRHWRRWSEALAEAGFSPNPFGLPAHSDEHLLSSYAYLTRELKHAPVKADLLIRRRADTRFPSPGTFSRFGLREQLLRRVREYCSGKGGFDDVAAILDGAGRASTKPRAASQGRIGWVYLIQSGRYYKIGRTDERDKRERAYNTHNPDPRWLHVIATDDPEGVENYWHRRFAAKKLGKHDFSYRLDPSDVAAFKQWKKIY